jgi:hypothetical protein
LPAGVILVVALAAAGTAGTGSAAASTARHTMAAVKAPVSGGGPQSRGRRVGAAAVPPPGYGTGPGYCTGYSGGVTSSYSFDNVYACQGTTTGSTTFDAPGPIYAWQCVELSARFLWAVYGIWAGPGSGVQTGADLVSVVHASHPNITVGTPGPGSVPVAGDIISLGPGGSTGSSGHTAVVISANPGTGQFEVMSENAPEGQAGEQAMQVDLSGGHNGQALFYGTWVTASWLKLGSTGDIVIRSGSTLLAKNGVTGSWVTEAGGLTSATKILAFGDMIGYIENNSAGVPVLWAKQGLTGTWYDEYGPVNAAVFTG